jgi:hypothetical protein
MSLTSSGPSVIPGGAHIRVWRGFYWHHGIHLGGGEVVHYSGLTKNKDTATIRKTTLARFADGGVVLVVDYAAQAAPSEVARRALSRLGENGYHAFGNNCEHFARWCMTGEHRSSQVEEAGASAAGGVGSSATSGAATIAAVSIGEAAGVKGAAALMRGLNVLGKPLGGGVQAGLITGAALPAVIANVAIRKALPDDPMLSESERLARKAGRDTTTVASILGAAGSVGLVSLAGVPGLSAVGIATGLAELGFGSMFLGVTLAVGVPALLALGLGLFVYHSRPHPTTGMKKI